MKHLELRPFLIKSFGEEWYNILQNHLHSDYFFNLGSKLKAEQTKYTVYPKQEDIFRAFRVTPFSLMKGVVLGQDPYHDSSATGLCFDNHYGMKISPSLTNILKELITDIPNPQVIQELEPWAEQGILMLNTALTVRQGEPNSHKEMWQIFTSTVLQEIAHRKDNLVWMMWGNQAQSYKRIIGNPTHSFICTSHPSPLGAYHGEIPFMGSKCFSKFNNELCKKNIEPIVW